MTTAQVTFTELGMHELKKGEGSRPFFAAHCPPEELAKLSTEWTAAAASRPAQNDEPAEASEKATAAPSFPAMHAQGGSVIIGGNNINSPINIGRARPAGG